LQGITFIIAPLLALIKDQVEHLQGLGINVVNLSNVGWLENPEQCQKDDIPSIAFITPKKLQISSQLMHYITELY
jgi:superfamily II DNA helicase RecQ